MQFYCYLGSTACCGLFFFYPKPTLPVMQTVLLHMCWKAVLFFLSLQQLATVAALYSTMPTCLKLQKKKTRTVSALKAMHLAILEVLFSRLFAL